jgi:hypothetical protein
MLRLFSALLIVLGMFALVGCQNNPPPGPVQPMEVNETTCCGDKVVCDHDCMHACKTKHVVCPKHKRHHHVRHHHRHRTTTSTTTTETQTTTPAPEAAPAPAPAQ